MLKKGGIMLAPSSQDCLSIDLPHSMGESREDLDSGEEESKTCWSGFCSLFAKKDKSDTSEEDKQQSSTNGENAHSAKGRESRASSNVPVQSQPEATDGRSSEDQNADVDGEHEVREPNEVGAGRRDDADADATESFVDPDEVEAKPGAKRADAAAE